jgi:short-subunit dehydrogenase
MKQQKPIALITGASAGIGAEFANVFAAEGYHLILVARSAGKLDALAAELASKYDTESTVLPIDLSAPSAPQTLFDQLAKLGLQVDVLVNNAGLLDNAPFTETPLENHLRLIQVNICACTALAHLFLAPMLQRGAGRILNVASTSAFQPVPNLATYAASKAFMLSLSEALWAEVQGTGVSVTALCPGFVNTQMISKDESHSMHVPFIRNLEADEVARQGFDACMEGKPLYINGLGNQVVVALSRLQPRPLLHWLSVKIGKRGF